MLGGYTSKCIGRTWVKPDRWGGDWEQVGHCVIRTPDGRQLFESLNLTDEQAEQIATELTAAFNQGLFEGRGLNG